MESQHRGPLVGFVAVAVLSGFLVGHTLRTQGPQPADEVPSSRASSTATPGASPSAGVAGNGVSAAPEDPEDTTTEVVVKSVGETPVLVPADGSPGIDSGLGTPGTSTGDAGGGGLQARGDDEDPADQGEPPGPDTTPAADPDPKGGTNGDTDGDTDGGTDEDTDGDTDEESPSGKPGEFPGRPPTDLPDDEHSGDRPPPGDRPLLEVPDAAAEPRSGARRP